MDRTTHFAPALRERHGGRRLEGTPLISVTAAAGLPGIIRDTFGERTLERVNRRTGLDFEQITDDNSFIPHTVLCGLVEETSRSTGIENLGLIVAPALSIANYGCWGGYVLGADSLEAAIERAAGSMGLHSNTDRCAFARRDTYARLAYRSAARGQPGYAHVACGIAGVMLSLCREYLGSRWTPLRFEFDIARPARPAAFEESFGCPVTFDAPVMAIFLRLGDLAARRRAARSSSWITFEDVARARRERANAARLCDLVIEQIRLQLYAGAISIEAVAQALDVSVRTLQRELNREGLDFRTLANEVRWRRGAELLRATGETVTTIALTLGYSVPAHFSRAFRRQTGLSPEEFRRFLASGSGPASEAAE